MAHRRPADLAHMEQTISAPNVHKSAKGTQAANFALDYITDFEFFKEFALALGSVFALGVAVREHKTTAAAFNFDHLSRQLLTNHLLELVVALIFAHVARQPHNVRCRNKATQMTKGNQKAAFVVANNLVGADLQHLFGCKPVLLLQRIGNAEDQHPFVSRQLANDNRNCVPFFEILDIGFLKPRKISLRNDPIALGADVHQ